MNYGNVINEDTHIVHTMDRCLIASIAIRFMSDTNEGREQERERKQDPGGLQFL